MFNFRLFLQKVRLVQIKDQFDYSVYFSKTDQKSIEKSFAKVFASEDGKKVLAYLQHITFNRAHSPDTDYKNLYFYEGQRALVGNILRLINQRNK